MIQDQFQLFKAPSGDIVNSYPITLIDGTGSMNWEYDQLIEAYKKVFSKLKQKEEYQWEQDLYSLQPFRAAGSGNITKTISSILSKLQKNQQQYPKNITIIFVSDGREQFCLEKLINQIEEVKKNYLIQFISFAIGDQFPNKISNNLRQQLHNQNETLGNTYRMGRSRQQKKDIYQKALKIFTEISQQLKVQEKVIQLAESVYLTFSSQPVNSVICNSLFIKSADSVIIKQNNLTIKPTKEVSDAQHFIQDSVKTALVQYAANRNEKNAKSVKEVFVNLTHKAEQLIQSGNFSGKVDEQQQVQFQATSNFVQQVAEGTVNLDELSEANLTKLQAEVSCNPQNIPLIVNIVSNAQQSLTDQQQIQKNAKRKIKNLSCLLQAENPQLEKIAIEKATSIFLDTLTLYKNKFEKEKPKNCLQILQEFSIFIYPQLEELFEELDLKKVGDDLYDQLRVLNNMLKTFDSLKHHKIEISCDNAYKFIDQVLEADSIASSNAVFDQTDEFAFLPNAIKSQIISATNQELDKILVVIFDQHQSMNQENDVAINTFINQFQNVQQNLIFKFGFKDEKYYFLDNLETNFQSITDALQQIKEYVHQKKIYLCYVSDGENEYQKFHKDVKSAKVTFIISLIYLTIGSEFNFRIINEIDEKLHNRDVKGKPIVKNIPRKKIITQVGQLQMLSTSTNDIESLFKKTWQEINTELFEQKEQKIGQHLLKQLF